MPTAIEDRIVVTDALGTQVKIKSEVFRDHSPSATARSSTGGTTSTRSPSSTHSAGRLAELVKHRPVRPSRDFYPERDGGDCTWPTACLQPVCPTCGFLARIGHAQPAHRSAHANRRPARLRPVGRARLRQRRTGCPERCRRPASTTCARRLVGSVPSQAVYAYHLAGPWFCDYMRPEAVIVFVVVRVLCRSWWLGWLRFAGAAACAVGLVPGTFAPWMSARTLSWRGLGITA